MPLQCLHTGCVAYSAEYGCFFRGDLYQSQQGTYILKVVPQRFYPPNYPQERYHMTIHEIGALWNNLDPYWVVITELATWYGHEGKPVPTT